MKTILLILVLVLHPGPGFGENLDQTSVQTVDSQVTVEQETSEKALSSLLKSGGSKRS